MFRCSRSERYTLEEHSLSDWKVQLGIDNGAIQGSRLICTLAKMQTDSKHAPEKCTGDRSFLVGRRLWLSNSVCGGSTDCCAQQHLEMSPGCREGAAPASEANSPKNASGRAPTEIFAFSEKRVFSIVGTANNGCNVADAKVVPSVPVHMFSIGGHTSSLCEVDGNF